MKPLSDCRLYGILDLGYVAAANAVDTARQMVAGGVDILQIRAKGCSPRTFSTSPHRSGR